MKTYTLLSLNDQLKYSVNIEYGTEDEFIVHLGEENFSFKLNINSPSSGTVINSFTNEVINFYFVYLKNEWKLNLWLNGNIYEFEIESSKQAQKQWKVGLGSFSGIIKAPMPGTILKILTEEGMDVLPNEPLIIMESMKMEMTITAPQAGRIANISCEVGQLVEMNAVLANLKLVENKKDELF